MNPIAILQGVMKLAGDVTMSQAITWLQVEENAQALLAEGYDQAPPATEE